MSRPTARGRVGDFDENSPRPPVPGEETDPGYCCSNISSVFSPPSAPYKYTPRSSSFHSSANLEGNAPLGFEPEGSCTNNYGSCSPFYEGTRSPPPCLQWAKNMSCLLQDNEGVELFRRYLEREGQAHADALNFWFACEGLKKQPNKDLVAQLVKAIYKRFIISPALAIREDLRREVTSRIRDNFFDKGVFDSVQADVGNRIMKTTYPNFLKSDIYLNYVRQIPQEYSSSSGSGSGSGSSSSSAGRDAGFCGGGATFLPTLPEDAELVVSPDFLPLTRDALVATQSRRALEFRPKPEAFAGVYLQHGSQLNTRVYSSYNPVSRQDSELQSLSSDARTDSDAMSCADNSTDGSSTNQYKIAKRQHQRQFKAMKENASMNRDSTHLVIPRTQRVKESLCPMEPEEFARQLIAKLEALKKEQEAQEKFDKKLMETESEPEKTFADMIREKLQMVDDQDSDNQAILDQHVSRVWNDTTPGGSPRLSSPRPKSPDGRRKLMMSGVVPHPYQTKSPYFGKYAKKEKDVFSTFSADSGNVHDFTDISESSRHFPKSKSFPDYGDTQNSMTGYDGRFRNNKDASGRRSSSKKMTSDLTDSGVSVISDTLPCGKHSTEWLLLRMKETCERSSSKHRSMKQTSSMISSGSHRHGRKSERSGSLERHSQQSYMCEALASQMVSRQNTASQLEEARRRLTEEECRGKAGKQRYPLSNKMPSTSGVPDMALSNSSTLRKSMRRTDQAAALQRAPEQEYTTVMYSFWDEEVPYRTKVAGTHVTLKQFKDLLPRKGSYRYFFKTDCAEVETKVIHEEIFDDSQELPLWEGKLIAQVKPLD